MIAAMRFPGMTRVMTAMAIPALAGCTMPEQGSSASGGAAPGTMVNAVTAAETYATPFAGAQTAPFLPDPNPLDQLETVLQGMLPTVAETPPVIEGPITLGAEPESTEPYGLEEQLADLREEVYQMRASMDQVMGQYVSELKMENERLRRELQRAYAGQAPGGYQPYIEPPSAGLAVPGMREPAAVPRLEANADSPPPGDDAVALAVHAGLNYAVIAEWGRSPKDTAHLGGKVSSLRGMVCVVPAGSSDESLLSLGRWFRNEYRDYDNINIEVFDSREAAQAYADSNTPSPEHRVLSVSKHRLTGRDTILMLRNGAMTEVGRE